MYAAHQVLLDAVSGVHLGTGVHTNSGPFVDVASVAGASPLVWISGNTQWSALLYQIDDDVVPNWFAVAVPAGVTSLSNPILFFHPTPAQAGFDDSDYSSKAGKWPELFRYADVLGAQLSSDRVVVMPFMTQVSTGDCGILSGNWSDICASIFSVAPTSLTVASFSEGSVYSNVFRANAVGLDGVLSGVWDFDGSFAQAGAATNATLAYAQLPGATAGQVFQVPQARWISLPGGAPANQSDTHSDIIKYLFRHACSLGRSPVPNVMLPLAIAGAVAGVGLYAAAMMLRRRDRR